MVLGVFLLLAAVPATAEKTDILLLKNGDRVTGEIDHLEGGLLIYKTDNMGTLNVEWEDISELTSKTTFRVELKSGDIHYGSLVTPPHGESLQVAEMSGNILVPMMDVAFIDPIHEQFWKRFDVAVDAGFSYTQANSATPAQRFRAGGVSGGERPRSVQFQLAHHRSRVGRCLRAPRCESLLLAQSAALQAQLVVPVGGAPEQRRAGA